MKKLLPIKMILILTITMIVMIMSSCMFKEGKYVQDNIVEEVAEGLVDTKFGLDLDFSPSSPEK